MTTDKRRLVQLLARWHNAVDAMYERDVEAEKADRAFDGGEWSSAAHSRLREDAKDALARRFGFADADVLAQVAHAVGFEFVLDYGYAYRCADNAATFFGYVEQPDGSIEVTR